MSEPLFIAPLKLEEWIEDGEVLFEDNVLTIFAQNASYRLEPAVRITGLLAGEDEAGWAGRVITVAALQADGAEHLRDSVIRGDTAYSCEEGFVGNPQRIDRPAKVAEPALPIAAAAPAPMIDEPTDSDLLADFLMKNL